MAVEEDDGGRSPETLVCEACGLHCKDPMALAVHQERHRPVDPPVVEPGTRKEISYRCPEGCGRNFTTIVRYRDHVPLCDGGPPVEPFLKSIPTGFRAGFVMCPECLKPFRDPADLSSHLERHREVRPMLRHKRTGEVISKPCPKSCGRHFSHWKEYEEHKRLCDGQRPLPANRFEAEAALKRKNRKHLKRKGPVMLRCEVCARDFSKAGPFSIHLRKMHGKSYRPSQAAASDEDDEGREAEEGATSGAESNGSTISELKDKSRELRRKADRLDEIANKIERLLEEADDLV